MKFALSAALLSLGAFAAISPAQDGDARFDSWKRAFENEEQTLVQALKQQRTQLDRLESQGSMDSLTLRRDLIADARNRQKQLRIQRLDLEFELERVDLDWSREDRRLDQEEEALQRGSSEKYDGIMAQLERDLMQLDQEHELLEAQSKDLTSAHSREEARQVLAEKRRSVEDKLRDVQTAREQQIERGFHELHSDRDSFELQAMEKRHELRRRLLEIDLALEEQGDANDARLEEFLLRGEAKLDRARLEIQSNIAELESRLVDLQDKREATWRNESSAADAKAAFADDFFVGRAVGDGKKTAGQGGTASEKKLMERIDSLESEMNGLRQEMDKLWALVKKADQGK